MKNEIEKLKTLFEKDIKKVKTMNELNDLRINYLGKKSKIQEFSTMMRDLSVEEKKECGKLMNELKTSIESKINSLKEELEKKEKALKKIISNKKKKK